MYCFPNHITTVYEISKGCICTMQIHPFFRPPDVVYGEQAMDSETQ